MKILFLCGCLEPGHDGVGDYTRRLAGELTRQGHQVLLLALNDGCVAKEVVESQEEDGLALPVVRLPAAWSASRRFGCGSAWVEQYDPQWLSLQFVLFGYHPKGLPYGLGRRMAHLGRGRRWHLMLHELWVGIAANDTLKHRLWGWLQMAITKDLLRAIKPEVIHTQCTLYLNYLSIHRVAAQCLPLFSNIKVVEAAQAPGDPAEIANCAAAPNRLILFGGLHPSSSLEALMVAVKQFYAARKQGFVFWYVGRNGKELLTHRQLLAKHGIAYQLFGEQSPQVISRLLSLATVGIATGPPETLERNGTVAAMLDHGLPILCVGRRLRMRKVGPVPMMAGTYLPLDLERVLAHPARVRSLHTLPDVAAQFVQALA